MRPIETLLTLANLLTFVVIVVPLPHVVRWMRYLAPSALLLAASQVLVEGPRWARPQKAPRSTPCIAAF